MHFLSPWVLPDAGRAPSSWQPGRAASLAGGCRERVQGGEKEKQLDMKGLAVTSWSGPVLGWHSVCLLLTSVALLCFGFCILDFLLVPAEAGESQ